MSQVFTNFMQARDQNRQLTMQAQVDDYQAELYRQQGMAQEQNILDQTRRAEGRAITGAAGAGVDVTEGSALENIRNTVYLGTRDALQARANAYQNAAMSGVNARNTRRSRLSPFEIMMSAAAGAPQDYQTYSQIYQSL